MDKRLRRAKCRRPSIGREFGMLLPAKVPIRQLDMMEFVAFGKFRHAASGAKIGDGLAIVARFFFTGCEREMIHSPRGFNWQERARVKFGKNSFAPLVLNHAEWLVCHPTLSVSGLRHVFLHLAWISHSLHNRLPVSIAGQGYGRAGFPSRR